MRKKYLDNHEVKRISEDDIAKISLSYEVLAARLSRDIASAGEMEFVGKTTLTAPNGTYFQSLPSILLSENRACIKWVSVSPMTQPSVKAIIILSEIDSGRPLAIIDAAALTVARTALLSFIASKRTNSSSARAMGFIGSGNQALGHLEVFSHLYGNLSEIYIYSRDNKSVDLLASQAAEKGLASYISDDPRSVVSQADIVISSVPSSSLEQAFLSSKWIKSGSFVSMVDLGRTWKIDPSDFDLILTDDRRQTELLIKEQKIAGNIRLDGDLVSLAENENPLTQPHEKSCFIFGGIAVADATIASYVYDQFTTINP